MQSVSAVWDHKLSPHTKIQVTALVITEKILTKTFVTGERTEVPTDSSIPKTTVLIWCTGVTPIKKKILIDVEHHIDCSSVVCCWRQGQCDKIGIFKSYLVAQIEPSLLRTQVTVLQTIELLCINIRAVTHSIKVPFHFLYCKDIIQYEIKNFA